MTDDFWDDIYNDDSLGIAGEKLAYTPKGAAQATSISVRSIFKEIAAGRLEACKMGPQVTLIPAESLKAWLKSLPTRTPRSY